MLESAIGVDLGGTKALFVSGAHAMRFDTGPAFSPQDFAAMLDSFIASARVRPSHVGIGVPGLVDAAGRVVACDVLPSLAGWRPATALGALGCPIVVVNDVEAALLEEMHDAPSGLTAGVVMVGTAIGAAFLVHGTPLRGTSGWAGELGYFPCGVGPEAKRLDEVAGGAAMAAKRGVGPAMLAELALAGEPESLAIIEEGGSALGAGLAAVVNLLNPSRLALGGGALELPGFWEAAERAAHRQAVPALWKDCRMDRVAAGERVVALGALRAAVAQRSHGTAST
jgi:predicted NBD/HSP70 family sugar kinase